jgi:phospholipid/cholesterol/gamma-HCH transport system substrate-binding protein
VSRSFRERNPLLVGVGSLLVLALAVAGAVAVGTFDVFERSYRVTGLFDGSAGLEPGDEVRLAGVKVGSVTRVEPDFETGDVEIEWKVLEGHDVSVDAEAHIGLLTLTGEKYLRLVSPGGGPLLADLPRDERRIPRARTQVPVEVPEVLDDASRRLVDVDAEGLDGVIEDLTAAVDGKGEVLEAMLGDLATVARTLSDRDAELERLVRSFDEVTTALADKDEVLVQVIETSERVLRVLADRRDELAATLGEGADAVVELSSLIERNRATLDALLDDVHRLTGAVARQQDDIDRGLTLAGVGLGQLGTIGDSGPWIDTIVRMLPNGFLATIADAYPEFGRFLETYQEVAPEGGGR